MGSRRVILKPAGISDSQASRLEEALRDAVAFQQELAAWSPHVLRFVGGLGQTDDGTAFFVEHEPAAITPDPFDPQAPPLEEQQLFDLSAALMYALHSVHRSQREGANAHGGLCPGVLLLSADNIVKVTDFGFASAVCTTLGADSYLNLAVQPGGPGGDDTEVTGTWEVLPPHEFDRHDRICAFVDPEKYRTGKMEGFEPGSDVIAAAFLLYLWAERRHPYLQDYPDAHRLVGMSEFMTMLMHRRGGESFREPDDPATQRWTELLDRMLARLPAERPSAAEAVLALAEVGITPHKNATLPTPEDVLAQKEKPAARPRRRTRAFAAVAAAVVVLGTVGAVIGLLLQGEPPGPDGPEPVTTATETVARADGAARTSGVGEGSPETPAVSPLAGAITQLRETLAESTTLARVVERLVLEQDGGGEVPPVLTYTLPGLPEPGQSLVLETTDADGLPTLSADQTQSVRDAITPLESLLTFNVEPTALIAQLTAPLADPPWANLLDRTRVKLRVGSPLEWRLPSRGDYWKADDIVLYVVFVPPADPAGQTPEIDLTQVELSLRLTDGGITATRISDQVRANLTQAVGAKLLEVQNASLQQRRQELVEATTAIGAQVAAEPAVLQAASSGAEVTVAAQGLRSRSFTLTWSPPDLQFTFGQTWQRRVEELLLAYGAVPAFNRKLPADHWIRQVSSGEAFEAAEPTDDRWTLAVPALWAPQDVPSEELGLADLLPITVPWPADLQDPEAIADLALAADAPPYWALLDDYRRCVDDPFFLANAIRDEMSEVIDAAEGQGLSGHPMVAFLTARPQPQYVLPRTEVSGKPALRTEAAGTAPTALELPVRPSWALQDVPPGIDRAQLASAVEGLADLPTLSVRLNLSSQSKVRLTGITALVNAFEPSRAGAAALEGQIGRLQARQTLDADLQRLVPQGTQQTSLANNALDILRRIWRAKGAPERTELADLQALSAALRARGGLRFEKAPGSQSELILPTIFVEYFCGPQFCYAVAWSTGNDTFNDIDHVTVDQPTLLRLCPSQEVFAVARGDAGAEADTLGDRLFAPVFAALPRAIAVSSDEFFPFHLGLVLALDDALWLISGLKNLGFASQETFLKDIGRVDSVERSKRWATLQELSDGNTRSDFVLVGSLSAPPPAAPPGPGERSAIETLVQATATRP